MTPPDPTEPLADRDLFDALLPMHARLDACGQVQHLGPGLARLAGGRRLLGRCVSEGFRVTRPTGLDGVGDLLALPGQALRLQFTEDRPVRMRGLVVPFADGAGSVLSLSLALSDLPDLGGAPLTACDFAPTDPTVDMLYLIEANAATMAESRRLIARLDGAKSTAEQQAFTDQLTGLGNRRALGRILARILGAGEPFSLTQLDLDFFKVVNDSHGHAAGDAVLRHVADRLRAATRATDMVIRLGGDEFVVVSRGLVSERALQRAAARILAGIETPVQFMGQTCRVSASMGTAISTRYAQPDADRIMQDADSAAYASKNAGRGRHTIHPGEADRRDDAAA